MARKLTPKPSESFPETFPFRWTAERGQAAISLASGRTQQYAADEVGVDVRTITNWLLNVDFAAEVDRLSLMVDVSSRAERLRIAMRVVRQFIKENEIVTQRDVLEWLKFAQSETDGVKLDLGKLAAAFGTDEASLADSRPGGTSIPAESETVN